MTEECKTGLVLEGGGMRGLFTAGVLDFFLDKNISFDTCMGVSAGSCHACSYLSRQRGRAYTVSVDYLDDQRYCSLSSLLKTGDLFGADMCYRKIPDELVPYDYEAYDQNPTDFYAVVTNCRTFFPGRCGFRENPIWTEESLIRFRSKSLRIWETRKT